MDDHSRRRRQNEPGMHANSSQRYSVGADPTQQRRSFAGGSSDRFRPSPINTSAAPRGMGAVSYSSYYQEPVAAFSTGMAQNSMPYQSDYSQDGRQTQGFGAYNPGMMYNVPQASTQNPVYDTSQQFQPRQPAALQMIAAEVPGPYFAGETTNPAAAAAAASGISGQQSSSNTPGASTVYQQSSATDRAALLQNYQQGSGMGHMSGISQSGSTDQVMDDQSQQTPQQQQQQQHQSSLNMNSVEEAYSDYQSELYEVFQSIESGSLANAGELLLRVSKWLLSKAVDLGLTLDNKDLHADRIQLWNDFNCAWLALFQKQKDLMESSLIHRPSGLISPENLEKMGNELIQMCDGIERHGLVDYQYGVWEERIISILTECVDLYETNDNTGRNHR